MTPARRRSSGCCRRRPIRDRPHRSPRERRAARSRRRSTRRASRSSSRSARPLTCPGLSSALTYSVDPGHPDSSWSTNVLLPIPGSPPSNVTDPATSPPPRTRSSSSIAVDRALPTPASTSLSRTVGANCVGVGRSPDRLDGLFDDRVPGVADGALTGPLGLFRPALDAQEHGRRLGHESNDAREVSQ